MSDESDSDVENDLNNIDEEIDNTDALNKEAEAMEREGAWCVECGDQPAAVRCAGCRGDLFCTVCWGAVHRKGTRKTHTTSPVEQNLEQLQQLQQTLQQNIQKEKEELQKQKEKSEAEKMNVDRDSDDESDKDSDKDSDDESDDDNNNTSKYINKTPKHTIIIGADNQSDPDSMLERAKYIPLRLSLEERKQLRLLEATLNVSEYTDKIDILSYKSKASRIHVQLKDVCAILSGLVVASDYKVGQQLIKDREFKDNEDFFRHIFEVGRRHKIMNPEKMRTEYGKLIYMLQDSVISEIQELLQFSCVKKVNMVYDLLEERGALDVLRDPNIYTATSEIIAEGKPRSLIQREIKQKELAIEQISRKHCSRQMSADEIKLCLYSIGDNNAFLRVNRDPCEKMIEYLTTLFEPNRYESGYSLAIVGGKNGARLTHSHNLQFHYALQSLTLWREITHDFFKLWYLAEDDLLNERNSYRLRDTGQGLNRVQACPRVGKAMYHLLNTVQSRLSKSGMHWVGSSVVHLGDHNVPNALMFIDKYTQVSRILNPIVICLGQLDGIVKDPGIRNYIDSTFGGVDKLKKDILADFYRSAFDGSGADNFFDAGSCIDGRLTSAWHWCSQLEKKPFFPAFLLTGFSGFDGEF